MHTRVITGLALVGWSLGGFITASPAGAQQFLVGAYLYAANASGATGTTQYQYDTNTADIADTLRINGSAKGIAFSLATGDNTFSFDQTRNIGISPDGTAGELGLFFSNTNTPYNPSTPSRVPDLVVARDTAGAAAFFVPAAGTSINDYHYILSGAAPLTANGATTFTLGTSVLSITAFSVANKPSGSFTVTVAGVSAATPEPGGVSLLAGLGLSAGVLIRRRRR